MSGLMLLDIFNYFDNHIQSSIAQLCAVGNGPNLWTHYYCEPEAADTLNCAVINDLYIMR